MVKPPNIGLERVSYPGDLRPLTLKKEYMVELWVSGASAHSKKPWIINSKEITKYKKLIMKHSFYWRTIDLLYCATLKCTTHAQTQEKICLRYQTVQP